MTLKENNIKIVLALEKQFGKSFIEIVDDINREFEKKLMDKKQSNLDLMKPASLTDPRSRQILYKAKFKRRVPRRKN